MEEKIYASQWLKIGNDEYFEHDEDTAKREAAEYLGNDEIHLLFDLVVAGKIPKYARNHTRFLDIMERALTGDYCLDEGIRLKQYKWVVRFSRGLDCRLQRGIKFLVREKQYDSILLVGRCIGTGDKKGFKIYADAVLTLMADYKEGSGSENAITCLLDLDIEVTMQVEEYFKTHNMPEAKKHWTEMRQSLRRRA